MFLIFKDCKVHDSIEWEVPFNWPATVSCYHVYKFTAELDLIEYNKVEKRKLKMKDLTLQVSHKFKMSTICVFQIAKLLHCNLL